MLGKILKIIGEGKIASIESLSGKLCVGPEITRVMVEDLVRRGYLRERRIETHSSCGSTCKGCSGGCSCNTEGVIFWELAR